MRGLRRETPGGSTAGGCHAMTSAKTPRTPRARTLDAAATHAGNPPSVCTVGEDASADDVLAFIFFIFFFLPLPDSENGFETRN